MKLVQRGVKYRLALFSLFYRFHCTIPRALFTDPDLERMLKTLSDAFFIKSLY